MSAGNDTRERLLGATIELLAGPGMAAVSARGIAARAEVNQGLVFYHFGSVAALVAEATLRSTEGAVMLYRAALRNAASFGELLAVGRRLHAEAASVGSVRVMAQLLAAGQSDPAYAEVARRCLDLWFAEVTAAVERLLDGSPVRDLVDVSGLARAVGASFIGLELYEGVDGDGAAGALDALAQLTVLLDVLDDLNPVECRLLTARLRPPKGAR
jgi:AcrR family transcriptional regulator